MVALENSMDEIMEKLIGLSGKQVFGVVALSAITSLILIPFMRREK